MLLYELHIDNALNLKFSGYYIGVDENNDGFGEEPYIIPGIAMALDFSPLVAPHTISPPSGPQDYSLLQVEGQPEVYWLQNNKLYWVTDWDVINNMSGIPGWDGVNTLPASVFNPADYDQCPMFISTGLESDGLLIREYGRQEVYIILGGEKHHFTTSDALLVNGFGFDDVIDVSAAKIAMFASGSDIGISGSVHNINKDTDYTTIQVAINAANPGDEIHVNSGVYIENIIINKRLTLIGAGADIVKVVAANPNASVFDVFNRDGVIIRGFTITGANGNGQAGIDCPYCYLISDNELINNYFGILNLSSDELTIIKNNNIHSNYFGIWSISNNTIIGNNISSNSRNGLMISGDNNTIKDNIASFNKAIGVFLGQGTRNNTIINNTANSNTTNGFHIQSSYDNKLIGNTANSNANGIYIQDLHNMQNPYNNLLYHNNLINNAYYNIISNASDPAGTSYWDNGYPSGGNYWSDYFGTDNFSGPNQDQPGSDGIGDTPYPIGNSVDRYPLMAPYLPPTDLQDKSLVQVEGQPEVYWLQNGILYWATDWIVIGNMSGVPGWDNVNTLPASEFDPANYNQGPRFIATDATSNGLLIRQVGEPEVYLIENGEKRHYKSQQALEWNGHSYDDVIDVSAAIIGMFSDGSEISISQAIIDKYYELGGKAVFGTPSGSGEKSGEPDSSGIVCSYVNFQHGAIECFTNGELAGTAYALLNPFFNKWASMEYGTSVLGYPISDMSDVLTSKYGTSFTIQYFANGIERGALVHNLDSDEVVEIHGAIYVKWTDEKVGSYNGVLGLVTKDEMEAAQSLQGTTGRYSKFENGTIHWISDNGDDNPDSPYRGFSFITYGDLDWRHTCLGGTNHCLGFPVMDEVKMDEYGHGYCKFEGGHIDWDPDQGMHFVVLYNDRPDLTITNISFSNYYPAEGEPITITATIKNIGCRDAEGDMRVIFSQKSSYNDFEEEGEESKGSKATIDYKDGHGLSSGESRNVHVTWNVAPVYTTRQDGGFILVEIDTLKQIDETDEENNERYGGGEVIITSRSDFKPEVDGYHFRNFSYTKEEQDQMIITINELLNRIAFPSLYMQEVMNELIESWMGKGGNCYGIASSSALYYKDWQKPVNKNTFDMMINDDGVKQNIYDAHIAQIPLVFTDSPFHLPIVGVTLEKEFNYIQNHVPVLPKIQLRVYSTKEGKYEYPYHSVLAYSTYESDTIRNVLIYDPNFPGMGRVMQFDLKNNTVDYGGIAKDGHEYSVYKYVSTQPPVIALTYQQRLVQDSVYELSNKITDYLYDKGKKWISVFCPVNVTITDQDGRVINDDGVNDIPDSEFIVIGDMKIFFVPSDLDYIVNIDAYNSGIFSYVQMNPLTTKSVLEISFRDIPITENSSAKIAVNSSMSSEHLMQIDYDGDGRVDNIKEPDNTQALKIYNIFFLPPITTGDPFELTAGSTLPIKFTASDNETGEFIYDETVNVTITDSTGNVIASFTHGTDQNSITINSAEEQYIVNFDSTNYPLNVGETYGISVAFGESDSLKGYAIAYFSVLSPRPGDLDGNGVVDQADFSVFFSLFGSNIDTGTPPDYDGDGVVGLADYSIFCSFF